jgi:hypothetical protein
MSAAVAPTLWDHEVAPSGSARSCGDQSRGHGATLDEAITRLWGEIMGHQAVVCPWCEGEMRPRYGAAALPVGSRCADCGASLS